MLEHRHLKALRGVIAAAVATFVALVSHVAAGAEMPGPLGILIPFALALPVTILLAGRSLSLLRLSVAVVISQALFHALFVFGTVDLVVHTGHAHHGQAAELPAGPGTAHAHSLLDSTPEMMLAHLAGAVVSIVALHSGERSLRALLRIGRGVLRFDRARLLLSPPPEKPAPRIRAVAVSTRRCPTSRHPRTHLTRGPPLRSSH